MTPPDDLHPGRPRREITVYACTDCEQRYLAQQWCTDCQRPCRRIDLGGLCPHCDEPVAIIDLLDQHQPPSTHHALHPDKPRPARTGDGSPRLTLDTTKNGDHHAR